MSEDREDERLYREGLEAARGGDSMKAVTLWRECVKTNPQHAAALADLGWHEESSSRPANAIPLFQRALDARPGWDEAVCRLVNCYRLVGDWDAAFEAAERGLRASPASRPIRRALARTRRTRLLHTWKRRFRSLPLVGAAPRAASRLWHSAVLLVSLFTAGALETIRYRRLGRYTTAGVADSGFRLRRFVLRERSRLGPSAEIISVSRAVEYPLASQAMAPLAGRRILDIGNGGSSIALDWQALGADVVTTDPSDALDALRTHGAYRALPPDNRPSLVCADGCFLPFQDASFDLVVSISTLEHIPGEGDTLAAREAARVLSPGGLLVLTVEADARPSEKWYDVERVGVQYESVDRGGNRPAPPESGVFMRKYTLETLRERLLEPSGLAEIDAGLYDDVLFPGRSLLDVSSRGWVWRAFRQAAVLAAQISYRRLPPGRSPSTSATAFLVARKPPGTPR